MMRETCFSMAMVILLLVESSRAVRCETEDDLDFEICGLFDMKDEVLFDICDRIGLSMEEHVLPYLFEDDETGDDPGSSSDVSASRVYTHEEYVRGAEECLLVEKEMSELGEDDLDNLEREALEDDPELLAQVRGALVAGIYLPILYKSHRVHR